MSQAEYSELKGLNDNVLHPMSIPAEHQREPVFLTRGQGVHVYDHAGRRYLDGMGGLWCVNVGHGREEMRDAIDRQLGKLAYFSTFGELSNEPSARLASRIKSLLEPEDVGKVFFSLGGSDAVETALKLSRQFWRASGQPSKTGFISLEYGYHGVHFGGTSLNGMPAFQEPYLPLLPGCSQIANPFPVPESLDGRPRGARPDMCRHPGPGDPVAGRGQCRCVHRRAHPGRGRRHRAAAELLATRAGSLRRARRAADRRRGGYRVRAQRLPVRRPRLGSEARHALFRQGPDVRLRAAGRDRGQHPHCRSVRHRPARRVHRARLHVLGPSAGLRGGARGDRDRGA